MIKRIAAFYDRQLAYSFDQPFDRRLLAWRLAGVGLVAAFLAWQVVRWYNTDMHELNNLAATYAQVGKEFQRREDLSKNMASIVENYAQHERELFEHVSDMRASLEGLGGTPSANQRVNLEQAFTRLVALFEQYPELKAEKRFQDLMDMAEISENRVAQAMFDYLEAARDYDTCNQGF
jgi:LemA protein